MKKNSHLRDFARYASLNVLGMIGVSCYILADTFFVAKGMGADGVTALNIAIPIYSLIHGTGLMIGMGGATKFAIYKSQGRDEAGSRVFTCALLMALVLGAIYFLGGAFFSMPLAKLLGAKGSVVGMTNTYLKVLMMFGPFFVLNDTFNCFIRNDGNPKLSMAAMLTGSFSNIILDYVFIFPLDMGIFGAILATGLSPVISLCILSIYKFRKKNSFHIVRARHEGRTFGGILSIGVQSLITELSSGIVVIANTSIVAVSIFTGIAQGGQPLISAAHGIGDKDRLRAVLRYSIISQLVIALMVYLAIAFFTTPIAAIFNSEHIDSLQRMAEDGMKIYFTGLFFSGFNIIISAFFAASEKIIPAQTITILRGFALIVPMAFIMSKAAGLTGVWLAYPVTEFIVAAISIIFYIRNRHKT